MEIGDYAALRAARIAIEPLPVSGRRNTSPTPTMKNPVPWTPPVNRSEPERDILRYDIDFDAVLSGDYAYTFTRIAAFDYIIEDGDVSLVIFESTGDIDLSRTSLLLLRQLNIGMSSGYFAVRLRHRQLAYHQYARFLFLV